jgi:hypothetical protein
MPQNDGHYVTGSQADSLPHSWFSLHLREYTFSQTGGGQPAVGEF